MYSFSVSYDLLKPGQNYETLLARLRGLGFARVLYSQWVGQGTFTAGELRDDLRRFIDANDRLLVIDVTRSQYAWHNLQTDIKVALNLT